MPSEVLWFRDENGNPQQLSKSSAERFHPEWKAMSKADFNKTFPDGGQPPESAEATNTTPEK